MEQIISERPSGIIQKTSTYQIILLSLRTGLRMSVENGPRSGPTKVLKDGHRKKESEVANNGMSPGTKKSNPKAKRKMKMVKILKRRKLKVLILKSQIAKNGVRMKMLKKSGMKSGENLITQKRGRNGVISGKLI